MKIQSCARCVTICVALVWSQPVAAQRTQETSPSDGGPANVDESDASSLDAVTDQLEDGRRRAIQLAEQLESVQLKERRDAAYALASLGPAALPALDALIKTVSDRDDQVSVQSIVAIGRIGPPAAKAVDALISSLNHSSRQRAFRSAWALSTIGDASVEPLLQRLMSESSVRRRIAVVEALGWLSEQRDRVTPALLEWIGSDEPTLRVAAAESLSKLQAQQALTQALQSEDPVVQVIVARAMSNVSSISDATLERLYQLNRTGDAAVQAATVVPLALASAPRREIIDAIVKTAMSEDAEARSDAVIAIRKLEDPSVAIDQLAGQLTSDDDATRLAATSSLGLLGQRAKPALSALIEMLKQPAHAPDAAQAIGRIGAVAVEPLLEAFDDPEQSVERIAETLALIGGKATPRLIASLNGESDTVRKYAAVALSEMQPTPPQAIDGLRNMLSQDSSELRGVAVTALARCARLPPDQVMSLIELRNDSNPTVRAASLMVIVRHGGSRPDVASMLIEAMRDSDADVRANAILSLANLETPPPEAMPEIAKSLRDADARVRECAAMALGRYGEKAQAFVSEIAKLLKAEHSAGQLAAVTAIGEIGTNDAMAVKELAALLSNDDVDMVFTVLTALGKLGKDARDVAPQIEPLMKHPRASIRAAAIACVTAIELETAMVVALLMEALDDEDWTVRKSAATGLGQIGSPAATSAVPKLLVLSRNEQDREAARSALRSIDAAGPDAIPLLVEGLESEDGGRRFYSIYLLGKVRPPAVSALPALKEFRDETDSNRLKELAKRTIRSIETVDAK